MSVTPTYRILALVSDAYGGHGGISRFNRDFLGALSDWEALREAVVFPRIVINAIEESIPAKVRYFNHGVTSRPSFIGHVLRYLLSDRNFDMLICGHINLLPIAWPLSRWMGCPLVLIVHGIDAWQPTSSRLINRLCRSIDKVVAVSQLTLDRFCGWSGLPADRGYVLPNTVDLTAFTPGPKNVDLLKRYGLTGKPVLMTLGRIPDRERYKGYDEVIELLPLLSNEIPNVAYLIAGDGNDRPRLEQKAKDLGLGDRVVFAGMIPEVEKADHYRLADAYVMPSRGEGFGIVLLEAMACGVPVVASTLDGGREALRNGMLGTLVDPCDLQDIRAGVLRALQRPRTVPEGLDYFSHASYRARVWDLLSRTIGKR